VDVETVLPLIILPIGLGAWRAWRRSPADWLRIHFLATGIFLLTVAAVVAVFLGVAGSPARHYQASHLFLVTLAALLLLSGFIAVTFRTGVGRTVRLPPGASPGFGHRRRLFPWIGLTAVPLLAAAGGTLLAPSGWTGLPLTLAVVVPLLASSVLYPLYLQARRFDHATTALLANPWVHWRYTAEQWQSWAAIRRSWERARTPAFRWKRDWAELMFPILMMAGATWILGSGGTLEKAGVFVGCVAVLLVSAGLLMWHARREPERRYRRMLDATPDAYLGSEGLYCSGEYFPWVFSGNCLLEAVALHGPPRRMVLTFGTPNGAGTACLARLIPVPEGREVDLPPLQMQLRALCPTAAVNLTAQPSWCSEGCVR
jgi:hypothetical protein